MLVASVVSMRWAYFANDPVLWNHFVELLWSTKVYVPVMAKKLRILNPKIAYYFSLTDSKRNFIMVEELNDFVWRFRFKEAAGEDWTSLCPWNQGGAALRLKFLGDPKEVRYEPSPLIPPEFHAMNEGIIIRWELKWKSASSKYKKHVRNYLAAMRKYTDFASRLRVRFGLPQWKQPSQCPTSACSTTSALDESAESYLSSYIGLIEAGRDCSDGHFGDTILLQVSKLL
jgi:hypothetical protein